MNKYFYVDNAKLSKAQVVVTAIKCQIIVTTGSLVVLRDHDSFLFSLAASIGVGLLMSTFALIHGSFLHWTGAAKIRLGPIGGYITIVRDQDYYYFNLPRKKFVLNIRYVHESPKWIRIKFPFSLFYSYSHFPIDPEEPANEDDHQA
jgi:hypothetical protein